MEPTWRAKVGPRWPSWSQDGPRERQDGQVGANMAKDAPTWADIGNQHGRSLRNTARVHQIKPSEGGRFGLQTVWWGVGDNIY